MPGVSIALRKTDVSPATAPPATAVREPVGVPVKAEGQAPRGRELDPVCHAQVREPVRADVPGSRRPAGRGGEVRWDLPADQQRDDDVCEGIAVGAVAKPVIRNDAITCEHNGHLHVFSVKTGKWEDIDTRAAPDDQDRESRELRTTHETAQSPGQSRADGVTPTVPGVHDTAAGGDYVRLALLM